MPTPEEVSARALAKDSMSQSPSSTPSLTWEDAEEGLFCPAAERGSKASGYRTSDSDDENEYLTAVEDQSPVEEEEALKDDIVIPTRGKVQQMAGIHPDVKQTETSSSIGEDDVRGYVPTAPIQPPSATGETSAPSSIQAPQFTGLVRQRRLPSSCKQFPRPQPPGTSTMRLSSTLENLALTDQHHLHQLIDMNKRLTKLERNAQNSATQQPYHSHPPYNHSIYESIYQQGPYDPALEYVPAAPHDGNSYLSQGGPPLVDYFEQEPLGYVPGDTYYGGEGGLMPGTAETVSQSSAADDDGSQGSIIPVRSSPQQRPRRMARTSSAPPQISRAFDRVDDGGDDGRDDG